VERIRAYLEASGLLEHTILAIYSDHGIEFFENQSWGQGNTVLGDDFSAKVPLIVRAPGIAGGRTLDSIVRTVDLAPTLLELCGIETPAEADGRSLIPLLRDGVEPDLPAYQETGYWLGSIPGRHPDHLSYPTLLDLLEIPNKRAGTLAIRPEMRPLMNRAKDRMLRRGRWKLIYQPLQDRVLWQLFDLVEDPDCTRDLAALHPALFAALRAEMATWLRADGIDDSGEDAVARLP
jgi:arylsulfatase A-like enzyme